MQHTKAVFWMIINSGKLTKLSTKLASLAIIGFLFISCAKEDPCVKSGIPSNIDITDEVKAKMPYKDFATLTFVDSLSGDTHVFQGKGWVNKYWFYINSEKPCTDGFNCQMLRQPFISNTFPLPIQIGMVTTDPSIVGQYIEVYMIDYEYYSWYGNIKNSSPIKDSLLIQGNFYYNVSFFDNQYDPQYKTKYGCLYNSSHGLLKVQTPNNTLELVKMENH
jgi:hypothetical protein